MLPLAIDRQLARQTDDGERAIYLNELLKLVTCPDQQAALEHRKAFIEARVRERIRQAEGRS